MHWRHSLQHLQREGPLEVFSGSFSTLQLKLELFTFSCSSDEVIAIAKKKCNCSVTHFNFSPVLEASIFGRQEHQRASLL
jgi:hypothetical protein